MQLLITAAGSGTRSGLDGHLRKEILPIYDCREGRLVLRPIIDVIINRYNNLGIRNTVVVLARGDQRTESYLREYFPDVEIVYQERRHGFGDAVLSASDYISGDFILNAGDGLIFNDALLRDFVQMSFSKRGSISLALMEVDDPRRYGVATVEGKAPIYTVLGLEEKPQNPRSNLALMAVYRLSPEIFGELRAVRSNNVELTPSINSLIEKGTPANGMVFSRKEWLSVGVAERYVDVLQNTLEKSSPCL